MQTVGRVQMKKSSCLASYLFLALLIQGCGDDGMGIASHSVEGNWTGKLFTIGCVDPDDYLENPASMDLQQDESSVTGTLTLGFGDDSGFTPGKRERFREHF